MWQGDANALELLKGSHKLWVEASAWYGGVCTEPALDVIDGTITQELREESVRTKLTIRINSDNGRLTPRKDTDPLAPLGQELFVRVGVGGTAPKSWIPIGWFRIDEVVPTGGWVPYHYKEPRAQGVPLDKLRWIPASGVVELNCSDRLSLIVQDQLPALMSPNRKAMVNAEVVRMVDNRMGCDFLSLPINRVDSSVVYEDNPIVNIARLMRLGDMLPRATRNGLLGGITPFIQGEPVHTITPYENMADIKFAPSKEGLVNAVATVGEGGMEATGEDTTVEVPPARGYAEETTGPLRVNGPLGRILRQHSSPFYTTDEAANKGANTMLRNLIAKRQATIELETTWNPMLEVPDTVKVMVFPDTQYPLSVNAMITDLEYSLRGGAMKMTVACNRKDIEAWTAM